MNTNKFDLKGNVYSKARPNYPDALFSFLLAERVIDKNTIAADIGSGTGIFTIALSKFIKSVLAVEPNEDMRIKAEEKYKTIANITSINATAENTLLTDCSVDLITVAQAFHWFDRVVFKNECKRILKPNGKVVLVWNDRDSDSEIIKDNFVVNKKYCKDFKGSSNGIDFSKAAFSDFFSGEFELVEFCNNLIYTREDFIARNLSSSYAPKEKDLIYDDYIKAVGKVFDKYQSNGTVKYPYITRCYFGTI
ncbi:MAG: class I SAM-dependent methyltransferase [Ruminococcaceae bacterium]|nr:class I SAM-dependent methyltransferase [Oscillospiraceae bacterium]